MNIISEEEAMTHPIRNHITRAMGTDEMVIVDIFREKLKPQDKILMATDGLTGYVLDDKIKELLKKDEDLDVVTKNLIDFANEVSGKDNTSVILIQKSQDGENVEQTILGNRYQIIRKIGDGGMAFVYQAKDKLLNRIVAVKVLRPEFVDDKDFQLNLKEKQKQLPI